MNLSAKLLELILAFLDKMKNPQCLLTHIVININNQDLFVL
ncbi:hypothetical protein FN3523_0539 [Francisella hispaniensis]|uniref:Uncharacterized protein n=1 Tax=Francisella hispaniensis TaxID=622488 RepID=F4BJQ2_9GAMM|nr:hypothetical protein FTA_1633 [Francisella tularensis subsp. holarctica FTNF002-00]ADA78198.1 hypothetical protein NE061598_02855 [Francisella tularensis subsp. tularensis NE061598]AEB28396.1 hypothetical protein FN3523_0539 [Francisella hispaniensis]AKE19988.1 hypothetical protein RO31_0578 [Francisella tularensis subsp. tularensis str. SCHU S4 substr. NR-28534]APA82652.1 hypothetical protein N894_0668 [Francisella tularensis subsp. novicida PA10-7858]EDZ91089.1 hypothetical protein FTG_12